MYINQVLQFCLNSLPVLSKEGSINTVKVYFKNVTKIHSYTLIKSGP